MVLYLLGVVFLETVLENEVPQTRGAITSLADGERLLKQWSAVPRGPPATNAKQGIGHLFFAFQYFKIVTYSKLGLHLYLQMILGTEQIPTFYDMKIWIVYWEIYTGYIEIKIFGMCCVYHNACLR